MVETVGLTPRFGPREILDYATLTMTAGATFGPLGPNDAG